VPSIDYGSDAGESILYPSCVPLAHYHVITYNLQVHADQMRPLPWILAYDGCWGVHM